MLDAATVGPLVAKAQALAGICGAFYLSGVAARVPALLQPLKRLARYSFLIFVAHEPLLTLTRKLFLSAFRPETPAAWFVSYIAVVGLVVFTLVIAFKLAERTMPRTLDILTGGRA